MSEPPAGAGDGRRTDAILAFARGGGRTVLTRQIVPYPFHITRPFRLYPDQPDLATLYLQSASGGLYRADHLALDITAGRGARVHVTTQSATVVHDTGVAGARQETRLRVEADAFLALDPDPLILFPGAVLDIDTRIVLADGARAIVTEGVASHAPHAPGQDRAPQAVRAFEALSVSLTIASSDGATLVAERARIGGTAFAGTASPLGAYRAYGSMLVLAPAAHLPDAGRLQASADAAGCLGGVSLLPNGAGLALRVLAPDGGRLAAGLQAAFGNAFAALAGAPLGRRRK